MVGLGRMGAGLTTRLIAGGHDVVAYDVDSDAVSRARAAGATPGTSLQHLVEQLSPPRVIWVMVPAGEVTDRTLVDLGKLATPGDTFVDGGNSHYTDTVAQAAALEEKGITLLDAGTSGGIWGTEEGFCLMVGGDRAAFDRVEPIFETLAPPSGYAHVGPPGAGHFVKMVHNGIEYALMQAYAEGFELLRAGPGFDVDVAQVSELWRHGSVVRSWLLDLAARALQEDPDLATIAGYVEDSGEGRWTVEAALDNAVPIPTIALSVLARFRSRQDESFSAKVVAALRREFGGHAVRSEQSSPSEAPPADP